MNYTKLEDHQLVDRFVNGDQKSIDVLIDRHKSRVYTYILMLVKNHQLAEDIFQDTFIKVIKSLRRGRYQEQGIFLSWVIRIAHNLIIDHFRKEKHMRIYSNDATEVDLFNSKRFSDATIEDQLIHNQITSEVRKLIEELPPEQKEVIMLRHYGGLSFREIAEQTDVSINTALGRMRYALINLRKLIASKNLNLTKM